MLSNTNGGIPSSGMQPEKGCINGHILEHPFSGNGKNKIRNLSSVLTGW